MRSQNTRYIVGLDHLRGFAALLIVFYHGLHLLSFGPRAGTGDPMQFWLKTSNPLWVLVEEGHTSVALFMVLSGFVFSAAALGQEIAYGAFLKNRFLRIYPLFIVVLTMGLCAYPASYSFSSVLQALLFQSEYLGAPVLPPYSSMFWAVGVEFQFYLLFPFLHRFVERDGIRWAFGCIALCILLRLMAATVGASNARDIAYWHLLGRLDQFLLGMLGARAYRRLSMREAPWGKLALGFAALVLTALCVFNRLGGYPADAPWKVVWPTIEGTLWVCLLVTYALFAERVPRWLSKPLAGLGTISYSIYLLHYICILVLPHWIDYVLIADANLNSQLYVAVVVLPVLLPLAALSYYVIERPFLAMRTRYLRPAAGGKRELASAPRAA